MTLRNQRGPWPRLPHRSAGPGGGTYHTLTHLGVPGHPNETALRFLPDVEVLALVRREGSSSFSGIDSSRPLGRNREWSVYATEAHYTGPAARRPASAASVIAWTGPSASAPRRKEGRR
jgi:hypothetical protein